MNESPTNPLDITTEMMSQTTSALLANMATNVSLNASGDKESTLPSSRLPLHPIHNDHNEHEAIRVMGPNEKLYRQKHQQFVTDVIRAAVRNGAVLPRYKLMNSNERMAAMRDVNQLLSRLNCASVVACGRDETFGSATTLGDELSIERDAMNETNGSATTLDQTKSPSTTFQSVSLLEESLILLSDEESQQSAAAEEEVRFSTATNSPISPIERPRHATNENESTLLTHLSSPSFSRNKHSASNSGKRGLKSKFRHDLNDQAESCFKHFSQNDLEDAFSCGIPIQRRFSCFDLKSDDVEEESRFSQQVDFENGEFEGDDFHEQQPDYQQSQWSSFKGADPKLTFPEGEEDDSPVKRRAIRFDGLSQRVASSRKQSTISVADGLDKSEEESSSLQEQMADMAVQDKSNSDEDPIQTVRNLSRRAKALESQGVDSSTLQEVAPIDIRMKNGAHFRMDPLRCRQTKAKSSKKPKSVRIAHPRAKSKLAAAKQYDLSDSENSLSDPEPSFTDPISKFPTRVAARLNGAFEFLTKKESDADQSDNGIKSCGVLISMPIDQCVSLTSKLLIQTIKSARSHQRSVNGLAKKSKRLTPSMHLSQDKDVLAGGTLIVLRGKEDTAQWEVALREYTSLSVMNHAEMQANLRKLANTAAKCAGFDVVLSTYDAIKAKEVTVPVDENGRAMLESNNDSNDANDADGGWLSSRIAGSQSGAQAPRACQQLSVLHRMSWHRLIMMDVLGRKGFLIKPGTARAQAVVAINSLSRFILFEKEDDATGKPTEKFKDDRRQLRSVTTALQLPTTFKLDKFISNFVLDVNKVGRNETQLNYESSSELEESDCEEEYLSDDENLTEPYSY